MSNPNDPTQPNPKKPEDENKEGEHTPRSSFDFELPPEVGSYSELPPVPEPDALEPGTENPALPPRPEAVSGSSASFGFIDLPPLEPASGMISGVGLPVPASPPEGMESGVLEFTPTVPNADPSSVGLGESLPTVPTDDSTPGLSGLGLPAVPTPESSASSSSWELEETGLPTVPGVSGSGSSVDFALPPQPGPATSKINPMSSTSIPDISLLFGTTPEAVPPSPVGPSRAVADFKLPGTDPASSVVSGSDSDLPMAESTADVFGSDADLPVAEPLSDPKMQPIRRGTPTPDLDAVLGDQEPGDAIQPVAPAAGWLDPGKSDPAISQPAELQTPEATPVTPPPSATGSRSSFDFKLSQSDMDPVKVPGLDDTGVVASALPPRPVATERPSNVSFDFIDLPPEAGPGSGVKTGTGLQNIPTKPTAIDTSEQPLLTPTNDDIVLPPVNIRPTQDPEAAVGDLEITPASGWLDSGILPSGVGSAGRPVDPLELTPSKPMEGSDIFAGRVADAIPVEQSDVIAATAYNSKTPPPVADANRPPPAARPSDVALTFDDAPPGESSIDGINDDLPLADEVYGSSQLLGGGGQRIDTESIHDMPGMTGADPLFDSSRLAETPDLPSGKQNDGSGKQNDVSEYGRSPAMTSDASSILGDLNMAKGPPGTDSSSVRVESPGLDRTLTSEPAEGGFDLTVPEEPIPGDLFDDPSDAELSESTDWHPQSGSDLFAERRPSRGDDLEQGSSDQTEPDLSDDPSLATASSSIFADSKLREKSGSGFAGSSHVQFDDPRPEKGPKADADFGGEDADFGGADADFGGADAEFADFPEFGDPSEQPKNSPPAAKAPRRENDLSSADFTLPPEATAPNQLPTEMNEGGAIDWDDAALSDDESSTFDLPDDASLSSILRGLPEETVESPTREKPFPPGMEEDEGLPSVTVDWMANSAEGTALDSPEMRTEPELEDRANKRRAQKEQEAKAKSKPAAKSGKKARDPDSDAASAETRIKPASGSASPVADEPELRSKTQPKAKEKPAKKGGGMLVGLFVGAVVAGAASAGVYFSGLIPNSEQGIVRVIPNPNPNDGKGKVNPQPVNNQPQATDAKSAFAAGDIGKALEMVKANPAKTTAEKASSGSILVYSKVNGKGNDEDLKQGRANLKAVVDDPDAAKPENVNRAVKAAVDLGVSYVAAGDIAGARRHFTQMKTKFREPKYQEIFDTWLFSLNEMSGGGTSRLLTPAEIEKVMLSVSVLLADDTPKVDDPEPGLYYWKAMKLAREGSYKDAIEQIKLAKAAHQTRAKALAGRGLNPLTDPLEQMFPRACDELAAYWRLKGEDYRKTLDALATATKDLNTAKANLKTASDKVTKLEKDADKLDKDIKAAKDDLNATNDKLKLAEKDAKDKDDVIKAVAVELKPAVTLPEKWTPAELIAGVKNVATFAKDKDLKSILDQLAKAQAAAKVATDKLKTVTEEIATKYEADIKKLKDDQTADVKKLKADYDTAIKAEQAKTEAAKKEVAIAEVSFRKQLANAVTPSQALDIWLPLLTKLRRVSDADPAIAIAKRSLASAIPDSDDEAKAHTTIGMAQLLKGNYGDAKDEFQIARRSPAYKEDKEWAKIADAGLDAITDPLSPYRTPVVLPPVDVRAATKSLDMGIYAYRAGKYKAAEAALADAAKNDPADPVTWYYLGAARWQLGDDKQALKDFAQGSEREKFSPQPARTISEALTPIQGPVREAIDKVRP